MQALERWWLPVAIVMLFIAVVHARVASGQNRFQGRRLGSAFGECPPEMTDEEFLARRNAIDSGEVSGNLWGRFQGWVFRRYAGSVEMVTKTRYPLDYSGDYYFTPWQPSWIRGPVHPGLMSDQQPWNEMENPGPYPVHGPVVQPLASPKSGPMIPRGQMKFHGPVVPQGNSSPNPTPRAVRKIEPREKPIARSARGSLPYRREIIAPQRKEP